MRKMVSKGPKLEFVWYVFCLFAFVNFCHLNMLLFSSLFMNCFIYCFYSDYNFTVKYIQVLQMCAVTLLSLFLRFCVFLRLCCFSFYFILMTIFFINIKTAVSTVYLNTKWSINYFCSRLFFWLLSILT